MKGRFSTLFFAAAGLLFLLDSAHSQILSALAAPPVSLETEVQQIPEPTSEIIHVVRRGDNLIRLAQAYDTTPEVLMSANGLKDSTILIGQKLRIPVPQSAAAGQEAPETKEASALSHDSYTVRRGDNLIGISRIYNTTPEALMSANGLKNSKILIGQSIRVPIPRSAAVKETPDTKVASASSYTPAVISNVLLQQEKGSGENVEPRRVRLVEAGFKLLGAKYRFSGLSEKSGFDCSGLVKNLFSKFNIDLPHSSREQFKKGEKVDRDKLEEGDLVFFSSGGKLPNHVGIYIGNDHFIHAARKAKKVIVSDLNQLWYAARYLGARRITDLWGEDKNLAGVNN